MTGGNLRPSGRSRSQFIKLYLRSIEDLEPILDLFTPHGRTTTSIVHSAPVPTRSLPAFCTDSRLQSSEDLVNRD